MENLPFALLASLPLIFNLIAFQSACEKFVEAVGLSLFFMVCWMVTYKIAQTTLFPDSTNLYPLLDLMAGALAMAAWREKQDHWMLVIAILFGFQCINHVAFGIAWLHAPTKATRDAYLNNLNPIFVLQGLILLSLGGGYVARLIFDGLHVRPLVAHYHHGKRG